MNLSRVAHLPVAAFLAVVIAVGMPALARLQPKPADDPWLRMRPQLSPVGGQLMFEGRPVEGAIVTFVSDLNDENREYLAVSSTDKDGRFWLRTFSSFGDGAVPGSHRIRVEKLVPTGRMLSGPGFESILDIGSPPRWVDDMLQRGGESAHWGTTCDPMMAWSAFPGVAEMVNVMPARFADEETSGLSAEVSAGGANEFLIRLYELPPEADSGT